MSSDFFISSSEQDGLWSMDTCNGINVLLYTLATRKLIFSTRCNACIGYTLPWCNVNLLSSCANLCFFSCAIAKASKYLNKTVIHCTLRVIFVNGMISRTICQFMETMSYFLNPVDISRIMCNKWINICWFLIRPVHCGGKMYVPSIHC